MSRIWQTPCHCREKISYLVSSYLILSYLIRRRSTLLLRKSGSEVNWSSMLDSRRRWQRRGTVQNRRSWKVLTRSGRRSRVRYCVQCGVIVWNFILILLTLLLLLGICFTFCFYLRMIFGNYMRYKYESLTVCHALNVVQLIRNF